MRWNQPFAAALRANGKISLQDLDRRLDFVRAQRTLSCNDDNDSPAIVNCTRLNRFIVATTSESGVPENSSRGRRQASIASISASRAGRTAGIGEDEPDARSTIAKFPAATKASSSGCSVARLAWAEVASLSGATRPCLTSTCTASREADSWH